MRAEEMAKLLKEEMAGVTRFALFLTKSCEDAEDLAQDTMERALLKAHLFDGANLKAWLFTMCRRIFLNDKRRQKVVGVAVELDDAPAAATGLAPTQDVVCELNRTAACMERLSPNDRSIIALVALRGAKYEEAARLLKTPVGTVRSRLSRARARLKDLVETSDRAGPGIPA